MSAVTSVRRAAVALLVAAVAACGGSSGGGATPDVAALRAELEAPGPYPVGVRRIELTDLNRPDDSASRGARFLTVEVWYPAAESARARPTATLDQFVPRGIRLLAAALDLPLAGVRDAEVAEGGPFPVIGFSHGNQGLRYQNFTLAGHLASHGFVVFSPDHIGNAIFAERDDGSVVFYEDLFGVEALNDRIADMRFLMDQFRGFAQGGGRSFLAGHIDVERGFGMAGHSFGGATAIGVAGADARVVSIMPLAASVFTSPPDINPPVRQPSLIAIATEDKTIGQDGNAENVALFAASTGRRLFAEFPNAGHFTFSDACALALGIIGGSDGCGDGTRYGSGEAFTFLPADEFNPLQNGLAAAFFNWSLNGDRTMIPVLRSNPDGDEILYDTTAF